MKVAFIGKPNKGSWQIRAIQLTTQLRKMGIEADSFDIRHVPVPKGYDRLIYVKRGLPSEWPDHCPVYWDPVDFWRQPMEDSLDADAAIALAKSKVPGHVQIIAATRRMGSDLNTPHVLYHHYRPTLRPIKLRDKARVPVVVYDGHPRYLGRYVEAFANNKFCTFVQTDQLHLGDAVLAVRDAPYKGYMSRCWKSNVKAANALAVGRVVITDAEAGCLETLPSAMHINIKGPEDLSWAVSQLTLNRVRHQAYEAALPIAPRYSVSRITEKLVEILR